SFAERDEAQDRAAVVHCFTEAKDTLQPPLHFHKDDPKNGSVCAETAATLKERILDVYHSIAAMSEPPLHDDHIAIGHNLVAGLPEDKLTFGDLIKLQESINRVEVCIKTSGDVANSPAGMKFLSVVDRLMDVANMALWETCPNSESL
ncbi:hypothetical protein BGZ97_011072, partial [Linnemannia gamsii]